MESQNSKIQEARELAAAESKERAKLLVARNKAAANQLLLKMLGVADPRSHEVTHTTTGVTVYA